MFSPNPERAVVEMERLRDYILNPDYPRGKHKARVFQSALGIGREEAPQLQQMLLSAALTDSGRDGRE